MQTIRNAARIGDLQPPLSGKTVNKGVQGMRFMCANEPTTGGAAANLTLGFNTVASPRSRDSTVQWFNSLEDSS